MKDNTKLKTLEEQKQLIKENEILSKVLLEIIYRDKENMTDEQIDELFKREDWKEITEFNLEEHKDGWWMGCKGIHSWLVRPRKPLAIFKRLKKKKAELVEENCDYQKKTAEQALKIEELEQKVKELTVFKEQIEDLKESIAGTLSNYYKEEQREERDGWDYWCKEDLKELISKNEDKPVEVAIEVIEKWEQDAKSHSEAVDAGEEWKDRQVEGLREEVKEAKQGAEQSSKLLERKDLKIIDLEQEVKQLKSSLEAANKIMEKKDLEDREPYFFNKELPSLPKEESKFKQFKSKTKTKFRQFKKLVAKKKVQEREFVCRVEVGNK